jgi:4-hydroxybenzoate polyprenyltransferase
MPASVDLGLPSVGESINTAKGIGSSALGFGTPQSQMVSNAIIAAALIATSAVGLIGTLVLLPIPVFLFGVGAARLLLAWIR